MKSTSLARIYLVFLLVVGGIFLPHPPASAHSPTSYFTAGKWPTSQVISYGINIGFPTGSWRSRLVEAKDQWNNSASTGEPKIYWYLADDVNHGSAGDPCGISGFNTAAIFWNDLDYLGSNWVAATRLCPQTLNSTIYNFTIEFDSTRSNWYSGNADNPGGNVDFWSVATHEFGHALGFWEHIPESDGACPDDSTRATMCPSTYLGTERQRTVSPHDVHTFDAAY
ncbi:hypothetical protein Rhe02_07070 [Rhizocola hellebori]|uniref:Peptidase M10 metallopeptidase domain-containing protein n=1 Tax=Rhizocola hellebori TaxID=1392758 RepID=A0A8J3Q2J8_9ACTN|nr:hypothetical protein [Rhizocola hellebori]GIH02640.1 hypothetical protein Rhe02_07070 [Rhizocola hellebori]